MPLRMCVACRKHRPQEEMIKVVKNPNGLVLLDSTYKLNGRGAYVCRDSSCIKKCIKAKCFDRALKIAIGQEIYDALVKLEHNKEDGTNE